MKVIYSIPFTTYEKTLRQLEAAEFGVELAVYQVGEKSREITKLPHEKISSFHGPNLPITERNLPKLKEAAKMAFALGLDSMILHPHKIKGSNEIERLRQQKEALCCIDKIMKSTGCRITIETFGGKNRILRPKEMLYFDLPIVLDTSHLKSLDTLEIILENQSKIYEVHLSEKINESLHQPIRVYGEIIIESLLKQGWNGILCFEYTKDFYKEAQRDADYAAKIVRGIKAMSMNLLGEAEELFRRAVEIKPDGYLGNYCLGTVLLRNEKYSEARKFLENSNKIHPAHSATLLFLSYINHAFGKHEVAREFEEKYKRVGGPHFAKLFTSIQS